MPHVFASKGLSFSPFGRSCWWSIFTILNIKWKSVVDIQKSTNSRQCSSNCLRAIILHYCTPSPNSSLQLSGIVLELGIVIVTIISSSSQCHHHHLNHNNVIFIIILLTIARSIVLSLFIHSNTLPLSPSIVQSLDHLFFIRSSLPFFIQCSFIFPFILSTIYLTIQPSVQHLILESEFPPYMFCFFARDSFFCSSNNKSCCEKHVMRTLKLRVMTPQR